MDQQQTDLARLVDAVERIADALERLSPPPAAEQATPGRYESTLARIAHSRPASAATSWASLLTLLDDPMRPDVTLRRIERDTGMSRKKITNALKHTDLLPWPTERR
jgi:hypothetical protein